MNEVNNDIKPVIEEYKLLVDVEGKYKQEVLNLLDKHTKDIKKKLQQGCMQDEYILCNKLIAGMETTRVIVEKIWKLAREQSKVKEEQAIFDGAVG